MKIKFLGAARTVTGSCYIIETGQSRFAVDCGMHQGGAEIEKRNWDVAVYEEKKIDFFIITHAHIDHCGLLPRLVQKGFRGPIYATGPTADLMKILLLDSAHIQEVEAGWKNKKMQRTGRKGNCLPLYTIKDAEAVAPLIVARNYEEIFSPTAGIKINFRDAGHILGASMAEIFIDENGSAVKLVFSGDIGRPRQLLMNDPVPIYDADFLFMESTYGNRNHKGEEESLRELADAIAYSYNNGEKVVIPAFAVERTQEILYSLHLLSQRGKLPGDMPVYLDSPLAIRATEIFRRYLSYLDRETHDILKRGEDPLSLPQLKLSLTTEQSVQINELNGPAVIISASGMANAGRVKHHLRHNLWREGASVVFVGFQAEGTPGRRIVDGAKKIRIFNEDIAVNARIFTINGFSAHAGRDQLLAWLQHFQNRKMQVFLMHGEYSAQEHLAALIRGKYGFATVIPEYLEEIRLQPGAKFDVLSRPQRVETAIPWDAPLEEIAAALSHLKYSRERIKSLPQAKQQKLLDLLQEANRAVREVKSLV